MRSLAVALGIGIALAACGLSLVGTNQISAFDAGNPDGATELPPPPPTDAAPPLNPSCDAMPDVCAEIPPPRPLSPLSTAVVTSRRPTFRFLLAPGTDGAHIDICRERACTTILTGADIATGTATPPVDLPTGVLFWRLRGRTGELTGTRTSPTWQFTAARRSAPHSTSWGTVLDVNGDGFADLAVGSPGHAGTGVAVVYQGSATGLGNTISIGGESSGDQFGVTVASAGDIDGDGYCDLLVGAPWAQTQAGRVYLYRGGPNGTITPPIQIWSGEVAGDRFGTSLASAGDVNGDGYADVIVGASLGAAMKGRAYVYYGGPMGPGASPTARLTGASTGDALGSAVAWAGDVNGDGLGDVLVGALGAMSAGRAYLYLGPAVGLGTPSITFAGETTGDLFGGAVASAGDVDGDGYADMLVGAPSFTGNQGKVYLFRGGITPVTTAARSFVGPAGTGTAFGRTVAWSGDVDGDGLDDFAVGAPFGSGDYGSVTIYIGGLARLAPVTYSPMVGNSEFGYAIGSGADFDGDGLPDVPVGAFAEAANEGAVYLLPGVDGGVDAASSTRTQLSPLTPGDNFGKGLSLWRPSGHGHGHGRRIVPKRRERQLDRVGTHRVPSRP
jgi:hypothetical protein